VQLYLWQPRGLDPDAAMRRFGAVLDRLAARYASAYGRAYPVRAISAGDCCLGLVGPTPGVAGAEAALDPGRARTVLVGVAEPDPDATSTSISAIPAIEEIDVWSGIDAQPRGRWAAVAWRDGEVVALNGAAQGLRLWWTEGQDGWALGALMTPILELVGRARTVDLEVAALSVAQGFIASSRGIYQGTHRFMPGQRVLLGAPAPPALERLPSLDELLGPRRGLSYPDVVEGMASRASAMTAAAAARCENPTLGLSGGRDSRLLAAALARAGQPIAASTGGPISHPDVVVARQVAEALGLEHSVGADPRPGETEAQVRDRARTGGGSRAVPMTAARLAAWVTLHDGTAPATLARVNPDRSLPRQDRLRPVGQLFIGLGGETHRGAYYARARDLDQPGSAVRGPSYVRDLFGSGVPLRVDVRPLIDAELEAQADALGERDLAFSEWMARYYYRFRETFRHADIIAQADASRWTFAPLMDPGFFVLSREAPAKTKVTNQLVEDVTALLAPELKAVPYAPAPAANPPEAIVRILARLGILYAVRDLRRRMSGSRPPDMSADIWRAVWEQIYFTPGDHLWPALIEERRLRHLVRVRPTSALLANLAVPEFLARPASLLDAA
jgi:hypothetical protein